MLWAIALLSLLALAAPGLAEGQEAKSYTIVAYQWGFEPHTIQVSKGDLVKITIVSQDVIHGFAIDEYGINVAVEPGKQTVVEFVAEAPAYFYCSIYCGSAHSDMKGLLIVDEERPTSPASNLVFLGALAIGLVAISFDIVLGFTLAKGGRMA